MRIVLLQDSSPLADEICRTLRRLGHVVEIASAKDDAARVAAALAYDLLVLDITPLRGSDAADVLAALGERHDAAPTLVLTAREQLRERVQALELGADCLAEPIAMPELAARLRALVRRIGPRKSTRLVCGALLLDRDARRAYLGREPLTLLPREWAVLEVLLARVDQIVAKEAIMRALSPCGKPVSANTIETHISRVRAKLNGAGIRIRTIHRVGYMVEAPAVQPLNSARLPETTG
jgi:two-component system, OmpR family, response regulator